MQLAREAAAVAALQPDLLEWRVDQFAAIADTQAVVAAAQALRDAAAGIPILFTRRSQREGGPAIALDEPGVVALYEAVAATGCMAMVDWEMASDAAHVQAVRALCKAHGLGLVLSSHDFNGTPPTQALVERFVQAQALGADVAKVAVMPREPRDVLRLMDATAQAHAATGIPLVSMAMGGCGAVSRLAGGVFGSSLTFAVGQRPSAPGQMPIADVRAGLDMLRRAQAAGGV